MVGFFDRLFGRNTTESSSGSGSGKVAKDRLQFVLVQDRINLPADQLQAMKREILEVISKYVTVDADHVDFALSNRERSGLLIAEIPFKVVPIEDPTSEKHTEEIKEPIDEDDPKPADASVSDTDEDTDSDD